MLELEQRKLIKEMLDWCQDQQLKRLAFVHRAIELDCQMRARPMRKIQLALDTAIELLMIELIDDA